MFVLVSALVAGVVAGYVIGGRLHNVEHLHLRVPWLALVAIALQLVAFSRLRDGLGENGVIALHFVSYGLLIWFVIANRRHAGLIVAGVGMGLNLVAITLNGGYMPASRHALKVAGELYAGASSNNSEVIHAGTRLSFLGDVFAFPDGSPLSNVFSVGDVLIIAGVAILIAAAMRASPGPAPERA